MIYSKKDKEKTMLTNFIHYFFTFFNTNRVGEVTVTSKNYFLDTGSLISDELEGDLILHNQLQQNLRFLYYSGALYFQFNKFSDGGSRDFACLIKSIFVKQQTDWFSSSASWALSGVLGTKLSNPSHTFSPTGTFFLIGEKNKKTSLPRNSTLHVLNNPFFDEITGIGGGKRPFPVVSSPWTRYNYRNPFFLYTPALPSRFKIGLRLKINSFCQLKTGGVGFPISLENIIFYSATHVKFGNRLPANSVFRKGTTRFLRTGVMPRIQQQKLVGCFSSGMHALYYAYVNFCFGFINFVLNKRKHGGLRGLVRGLCKFISNKLRFLHIILYKLGAANSLYRCLVGGFSFS